MPTTQQPVFLLASHEPTLLKTVEPVLSAYGACVNVVFSSEAALSAMTAPQPPSLVLLDADLRCTGPEMNLSQLLAAVRSSSGGHRFPIVLIADTVPEEWSSRLEEGVIDDVILRAESAYGRLRLDMVLRTYRHMRELELLRESAALSAQTDPLTGIYNRSALLSLLFRETDRVQRMKTSLSLILFDIDDFGHWNSRLGAEACDDLLCQTVARTFRLLRSYDAIGRAGKDEFLAILPGCSAANAAMFAERLRVEVFATPFRVAGEAIRLSACFGITASKGRSPIVVLREAEQALSKAKSAGPECIQCFGSYPDVMPDPVAFISPSSGDELLAW